MATYLRLTYTYFSTLEVIETDWNQLGWSQETKYSEQIITNFFWAKSSVKDLRILFVSHQHKGWKRHQVENSETL